MEMARTYEAISKSEKALSDESIRVPFVSVAQFPSLKNTDQMGVLKQKIDFLSQNNSFKVFHFASSRQGEGVSTVVINLARLLAEEESSKDILLIDGNLQRPVLHAAFNVPPSPGMSDALVGKVTCLESIRKVELDGIKMMPCGTPMSNVSGMIGQERLCDLIATTRQVFDYILIDSSPILTSSDSLSLANGSDTTFLVIQANCTQWEVVEKARLHLENNGGQVGGVILNRVVHVIPQWVYKRL